jgi:hypothetical protein
MPDGPQDPEPTNREWLRGELRRVREATARDVAVQERGDSRQAEADDAVALRDEGEGRA